jgi:hypothetical protein
VPREHIHRTAISVVVEPVFDEHLPAACTEGADDVFDDPGMGTIDKPIHVAVVPAGVQVDGDVQRGGDGIEGTERELVKATVFGT